MEILEQQKINKHKSGRKKIILNSKQINDINEMLLIKKYAPDIITYELRKNNPKSISTKTLYNMFKVNRMGFDENNLLRKGKNKPHKIQEIRGKFTNAKSIHEKDKLIPDIKNTFDFGHFEGDTIVGKDHKSSIITLADIKSKMTIPLKTKNHKSNSVAQSIINFVLKLPQGTIKTITFDHGKEFNKWKLIEKKCDIKIYFADSGRPCQRGLNENNSRILRRYFPKSTDLSVYTQKQLNEIAKIINSTPRKILNRLLPTCTCSYVFNDFFLKIITWFQIDFFKLWNRKSSRWLCFKKWCKYQPNWISMKTCTKKCKISCLFICKRISI